MAKIPRATFKQFAVNVNAASDICQFGSPATGSPVYTANIATLQSLTAYTTGWAAETIASNRPFLEDMNAVCYVFAYMLAYSFQMGIPEYDAGTTYFINSVVQYSGVLYQVINDNSGAGISGTLPTNTTYWGTLKVSAQLGARTTSATVFGGSGSIVATIIYQAQTDGIISANIGGSTAVTGNILSDSSMTPSYVLDTLEISGPAGTINYVLKGEVRKGDYLQINVSVGTLNSASWQPIGV